VGIVEHAPGRGPLALWGAWALSVSLPGRHWLTAVLGAGAVVTAVGLLLLQAWARPLAYSFAAALALAWMYAVWQLALRGWPYPDWLGTVLSLVPGALFLIICAGGAWVVHGQYRRR
jgi:hypothetical protein